MSAAPAETGGHGLLEQLLGGGEGGDQIMPPEGLTAAAFQEYLHKVDVRREEVLLTLYATVAERFAGDGDEPAAEGGGGGGQAADAALSASLAALQQQEGLAGEDPALASLAALAAQHAAVLQAVQETAELAASVRVAAELQQRLADFDAAAAAGSYSEAAWIGVELQKAVQAVPGSEDTAAAVAQRVEPLGQHLLEAVFSWWWIDPASRMPVLAAAQPHARQQQQQQGEQGEQPAGDTAAAAAALADAWRALQVLGLLPQALGQASAYFLEHSVQPILASEHDPSLVTDSPAGSVASSNLSRATAAGGGRGGSSVERLLYKALRGMAEQVLGGQAELAEQLGAALWPQLARAYIEVKLRPIAPQSDAEVELFSRKSALGAKLEQKAVKLRLLPAERDGPITRHIKHTLNRFLHARRNRFIAAARDLLTSQAGQEVVTVGVPRRMTAGDAAPAASRALFGGGAAAAAQQRPGSRGGTPTAAGSGSWAGLEEEDPLLAAGEYCISQAAQGTVNLMKEALSEAVRSGNAALAQAMCGAVVDVAAMLVALPPQGAGGGAAGSGAAEAQAAAAAAQQQALLLPYPAALRHNDCHYVYQALCSLPYQYAPRLQQLVHRNLNFVNPAARVRHAGEECLEAMIQAQQAELLGLVDELRQFAGLDSDGQAGIRCRRTVQQLLHAFRRLGKVLRGVLAPGVLVATEAALVQAVCGRLIEDIMSLPDISVDESEQIPRILEPLTSGLHDALLPSSSSSAAAAAAATSPAHGAAAGQQQQHGQQQHGQQQQQQQQLVVGGVSLDELQAVLHERTPAVMKLRELCELLDIRLVEIRARWQEGRLQAIGFSAPEVAHLVAALFEDTDLRRDFLRLLQAEAGAH